MLTEQQRLERKKGIGGSDVAAILGHSKYKTAIDVYLEKTTDYERPVDDKNRLRMDIGNALEKLLIDSFKNRYEHEGLRVWTSLNTFHDVNNNYLIANIDGLVWKETENKVKGTIYPILIGAPGGYTYEGDAVAILETKTARQRTDEWGEAGTNIIPIEYLMQIAHYCSVTDVPKAFISVFFKQSEEMVDYIYYRDSALEAYITERLINFWENHVLKGVLPPLQTALDTKFVYNNIEIIQLKLEDTELRQEIENYKVLSERIKMLEKEKLKHRDNVIIKLAGYGNIIDWKGDKLGSFSEQRRNGLDIEKLKKLHPEIYNECLKETSSQILRVK